MKKHSGKKRFRKSLALLTFACVIIGLGILANVLPVGDLLRFSNSDSQSLMKTSISKETQTKKAGKTSAGTSSLKITMLDVGQGLGLLLQCNDEYMLYDGGGREASSYVVSYLKEHKITELKYIIASHYDEDHIAGLVGAFSNCTVERAIIPNYKAETQIYKSFTDKVKSSGAKITYPKPGDSYTLSDAKIEILAPKTYDAEDDNNSSIVVRVSLDDFSCILTGDAQEKEENELLASGYDLKSTLYVVGHHGSSTSTSQDFLDAVQPSYAFISVGADNDYGHPTRKTLNKLKKADVKMFRTDIQGEVTLTTDGTNCTFNVDPCTDWTPGTYKSQTATSSDAGTDSGSGTKTNSEKKTSDSQNESQKNAKTDAGTESEQYVLNDHTKKFHKPSCSSVKKMSKNNIIYSDKSRDELIEDGYSPCGNCNP